MRPDRYTPGLLGTGRRALALLAAVILVGACAGEPAADEAASVEVGAELYQAHCEDCHGGATGGEISDIPPPHNAHGHTWHHPDCQLIDITLRGLPERPGLPEGVGTMPAFEDQLTEEQVESILAFIKTWWTEDQRVWQAEITEGMCP